MKTDTRKFCSSIESDCERAFGPFDTRQEAIDAAIEERDEDESGDTECTVGRCDYASAARLFFNESAERILEDVEDCAADNDFGNGEGPVFELVDPENGMANFRGDVRAALRKHFKSTYFIMDGPLETVALSPAPLESEER